MIVEKKAPQVTPQLCDFYSKSEDFNKWMKDKNKEISADEDNVAKSTEKFEEFVTDLSVKKKGLEQIDIAAKVLELFFPEPKSDKAGRTKETY